MTVYIIMQEINSYGTEITSIFEVYKSEQLAEKRLSFLQEHSRVPTGDGISVFYRIDEMAVQDD